MSAQVAITKAAVIAASRKNGRTAITAQAQQIVIQNLSTEDKETLTHLETVMNNIQTEFQNRKLDNYTTKRHRRCTLVPFSLFFSKEINPQFNWGR